MQANKRVGLVCAVERDCALCRPLAKCQRVWVLKVTFLFY
jgi:hypothetical protein